MSLSASKLPLAARCGWWARPDVALPVAEEPSVAALLGTALHAVADDGDAAEVAAALDVDEDDLDALAAAYAAWWPTFAGEAGHEAWEKEVPFAYDPVTGKARRLPSDGQRDYSAVADGEVPGTCDAVVPPCGLDPAAAVDLKTGRGDKTVAKYREQVEHAALCLSATMGARDITVTIAHVTPTGVRVDSLPLDAFDLADARARMRATLAAIPTARPQPGPHCREMFCPALACCPETTTALATIPEARRLPLVGEVDGDEDVFALVDAPPRFEAWLKERKAALKRAALRRAHTAADGRRYVYVRQPVERVSLEPEGAEEALRSVLGDAADEAIDVVRKTSKAAIQRAARKAGLPLADTERRTIAAMTKAGAVTVTFRDVPKILPPALAAKDGGHEAA